MKHQSCTYKDTLCATIKKETHIQKLCLNKFIDYYNRNKSADFHTKYRDLYV